MFKGPGIASVTGKFVDLESKETAVTFAAGAEVVAAEGKGAKDEKVVPYSFTPAYAAQKTGKFSVEIKYTGFDASKFTSEKSIQVYSKFALAWSINSNISVKLMQSANRLHILGNTQCCYL